MTDIEKKLALIERILSTQMYTKETLETAGMIALEYHEERRMRAYQNLKHDRDNLFRFIKDTGRLHELAEWEKTNAGLLHTNQ